MKLHPRMPCEEVANELSFMGREVVEDDINLLPRRAQGDDLFQEGDEVAAGVASRGFAVHAAGGGIERGI